MGLERGQATLTKVILQSRSSTRRTKVVLNAVGLLITILSHTQAVPVSMTSKGHVYVLNPGQTIEMRCEFEMHELDLFENPVVWKKFQRSEETQINIMGNIFEPFLSTKRFEITFTKEDPRYVLNLRIASAVIDDSGNYTCEVRGRKSTILASVTYFIFVRATVQTLYITGNSTGDRHAAQLPSTEPPIASAADAGATPTAVVSTPPRLTFVEGRPMRVKCVAIGGYPAPSLAIYLGQRDVTTELVRSSGPHRPTTLLRGRLGLRTMVTVVELGGVGGDDERTHVTGRYGSEFSVGRTDDESRLRCVATVPGLPPNTTETIVEVHYGPVIECESQNAYIDERNVHVRCQVRAQPSLTSLFWVVDLNGTTVSGGEVTNEYWVVVTDRSDTGAIETRLYMRRASPSSFRSYHLVAENAVSTRTQPVNLFRKLSVSTTTVTTTRGLTVTARPILSRPPSPHPATPPVSGVAKTDRSNIRLRKPTNDGGNIKAIARTNAARRSTDSAINHVIALITVAASSSACKRVL